jgi:hypothetical protein
MLMATNMEYWAQIVGIAWSMRVMFRFFSASREKLQCFYISKDEAWFRMSKVVDVSVVIKDG